MKYKLLDLLVCPYCKNHLQIETYLEEEKPLEAKRDLLPCLSWCAGAQSRGARAEIEAGHSPCDKCSETEIVEALLVCECEALFPVVRGIPRMLPTAFEDHRDFFERRRDAVSPRMKSASPYRGRGSFEKIHGRTKAAFSYEWMELYDLEIDSKRNNQAVFLAQTGMKPEEFAGKRVLDVGCGMGRNLRFVAEWAGEIVGMDLGDGVEQAARIVAENPRAHLVQGNIMQPPFKAETIDAAFSLGVLHHTPDARKSFATIASLIRPGGAFAVWLYPKAPRVKDALNDALRKVTVRLPRKALTALCWALVVKGTAERILRKNALTLPLAKAIGFFPIAPFTGSSLKIRFHETFDWYAPPYQSKHDEEEVLGWCRSAGFKSVEIRGYPVSLTGRGKAKKGEKVEPAVTRQDRLRGIDFLLLEEKK